MSDYRYDEYAFRRGFLQAMSLMFDKLSRMHNDDAKWNRKMIDEIWEEMKKVEREARESDFKERV